jgi:hypothetical protein
MTTLPLFLATFLYVWQAGNFVATGRFAMALAFVGYAIANVGLIWAAQR